MPSRPRICPAPGHEATVLGERQDRGVRDGNSRAEQEQGQARARDRDHPGSIAHGHGARLPVDAAVLDIQIAQAVPELRQEVEIFDPHRVTCSFPSPGGNSALSEAKSGGRSSRIVFHTRL
jgi:hypothetical protein